jgi:hypothetical protein
MRPIFRGAAAHGQVASATLSIEQEDGMESDGFRLVESSDVLG